MPIIQNTSRNKKANSSNSNTIKEPAGFSDENDSKASSGQNKVFLIATLSLIILCLCAFFYFEYITKTDGTSGNKPNNGNSSENLDLISLDIDKYAKLSANASLSKKEIQNLVITLAAANEANHKLSAETTQVILDVKKKEFSELKLKNAETLEGLHKLYVSTPAPIKQQFQKAIDEAKNKQSTERARLLEIGVTLLENIPVGITPKAHFISVLDEHL